MRAISQDEIQKFSAEQIAGVILALLQEISSGKRHVRYIKDSLESILDFELTPIWLGKNVKDGFLHQDRNISLYGGDIAPERLQELFNEGVEILKSERLIKQDPTQYSSVFVNLTEPGKIMKVGSNFELYKNRNPRDIIDKYKDSVFLVETEKNGEISCGTCFLINEGVLVSCKHNLEERNFTIHLDNETKFDKSEFDVKFHDRRDIALIRFKSKRLQSVLNQFTPLEIDEEKLSMGDQLITMGYPKVARRNAQLLVDVGTFQNYTTDYLDKADYLTFANRIDGGCSGGPVLNLKGKVVAVITESTEQSSSSGGEQGTVPGTNVYRHGTPISCIKDPVLQ